MTVTPQDWRVTAQLEADRTVAHVTRARSSGDLEEADVLLECWLAFRSAGAAVGSWAQGMLTDGRSWDDIGRTLDLTPEQARSALEPLVRQGWDRLQERLPAAAASDSRTDRA